MTKPERFALLQRAVAAMTTLETKYPGYPPFVSIRNQLLYLMELTSGRNTDYTALDAINLGLIAMREVEPRDEATAELLYSVSSEINEIKHEWKMPTAPG